MIIFIISLLPIAILFGFGLALHCWAMYSEQREKEGIEEFNQNEIRQRHRAELNVLATYYGGVDRE